VVRNALRGYLIVIIVCVWIVPLIMASLSFLVRKKIVLSAFSIKIILNLDVHTSYVLDVGRNGQRNLRHLYHVLYVGKKYGRD
jgi:hypothetical protein